MGESPQFFVALRVVLRICLVDGGSVDTSEVTGEVL